MSQTFDAIIIGAGQAGPPLAGRLSEAGMKVALIERKLFGGTCVNTGCTPTKTLVASARAAHMARRAADFGVVLDGGVSVDMLKVKTRQNGVVSDQRAGVERWVGGLPNCTVYRGQARFESLRQISVGDESLTAERIFINVGGRANIPALPGVDQVRTFTNTSLLALNELPRHLVAVGGSYVGLEFAQIYRRFGAEVTVVEMADRLIHREDADVSATVKEILEGEGIQMRLAAECIGFEPVGSDICVNVDCRDGDRRGSDPTCCSPLGAGRTLTTLGWKQPASPSMRTATSSSTINSAAARTGSGLWATATAGARSPTRPTTTSRSSRPISWAAKHARSATGSSPTPSSPIRRSAASGSRRPRRAPRAGRSWSDRVR
jgi:pyruvate/2-oxoglutarate dehydrogenase complex dihydrolipoamide dehydrogenase (E3) component